MIHLNQKIPNEIGLACSGGIDSMVVLDFLRKNKRNNITLFHVNHQTEHGKDAETFVENISEKFNLKMVTYKITTDKPKKMSWEEFWRTERYTFFHSQNIPIITAHHLNDCVETYLLSSIRGNAKLISKNNKNVIRPFLLNPKKEFENWASRNNIEYIQDMSNYENVHDRNIIRNEMLPIILKVNPGIEKVVKKLLMKNDK